MRGWVGCSMTAVVMTLAVVGMIAWGGNTYVGLAREQVRLEQAWSGMENAYLHRLALIPDVLAAVDQTGRVDHDLVERVRASADRAAAFVLSPEMLDEPGTCASVQRVQSELSVDLGRLLETVDSRRGTGSTSPIESLTAQIGTTRDQLAEAERRYNDAVARYNRALDRFPQRLVAALFDFRPRQEWRSDVTADGGDGPI